MYRCVFKIFVSLALALGLTTVVVGTTSAAQAAPAGVTRAAADCSAEQSALDTIRAKRKVTKQKLAKAKRIKKRTAVKLRRAKANDNRARVIKLKRKMKRLDRQVRTLTRRLKNQNRGVQAAMSVLAECQNSGGTDNPIQVLCPPLPQVLCDGLGGQIPGGSAASPIQDLCDAVPQLQPLCDAAGGGLPTDLGALTDLLGPLLGAISLGDLLPVQSLCDAGVPTQVCDALALEGGLPTTASLSELCTALPQLAPLCAAAEGGLPTDLGALTELLQPLLDLLGLGDLLGGGLTLQSLCDAGIPQQICDALGGAAAPGDVSLDTFCGLVTAAQPLCDAFTGAGGALPTDADALVALLEPLAPVLDALGVGSVLDQLIDDLLGGILCPLLCRAEAA